MNGHINSDGSLGVGNYTEGDREVTQKANKFERIILRLDDSVPTVTDDCGGKVGVQGTKKTFFMVSVACRCGYFFCFDYRNLLYFLSFV